MRTRRPGAQRKEAVLCPACGSTRVVPIVYGYPASDLVRDAEQGLVVLGGCSVNEADPTRACLDCDHPWNHSTVWSARTRE